LANLKIEQRRFAGSGEVAEAALSSAEYALENQGFPHMLVGYMRVSSEGDRQVLDLQRDARA
jgi:hypothetical protein